MGVRREFEIIYNRYLDEMGATYTDACAMVAHFQTIRVMNEKQKRDAARDATRRTGEA